MIIESDVKTKVIPYSDLIAGDVFTFAHGSTIKDIVKNDSVHMRTDETAAQHITLATGEIVDETLSGHGVVAKLDSVLTLRGFES